MTLLHLDGCDNDTIKFDTSNTVSSNLTESVIGGGYSLFFPSAAADFINFARKKFRENSISTETYPQIRFSFWMKTSGNVTSASYIASIRQNGPSSTNVILLRIGTDGKLSLSHLFAYSTPTYSASTTERVDDGNWHHIEIFIKSANDSNGSYVVYMDGEEDGIFNGDNIATTFNVPLPTYYDTLFFYNARGANLYIDDVFIWDDYTTDNWTGEKGLLKVQTIRPDSDSVSNSVPSSGATRYNLINQYKANTSNSISLGKGHYDLYEFDNVSTSIGGTSGTEMLGVATTIVYASQQNANTTNISFLLSNLTTTNSYYKSETVSPHSSNVSSYESSTKVYFYDPVNNLNWSPINLNDMKFGILVGE